MVVWETSLQALLTWMLNNKMLPQLTLPTYDEFGLHHAIIEQTWIGWKHFLNGFISTEWRQVQDRYYAWLAICHTGR
jgi:hypothetical protein